jgi:hypothetical protein
VRTGQSSHIECEQPRPRMDESACCSKGEPAPHRLLEAGRAITVTTPSRPVGAPRSVKRRHDGTADVGNHYEECASEALGESGDGLNTSFSRTCDAEPTAPINPSRGTKVPLSRDFWPAARLRQHRDITFARLYSRFAATRRNREAGARRAPATGSAPRCLCTRASPLTSNRVDGYDRGSGPN